MTLLIYSSSHWLSCLSPSSSPFSSSSSSSSSSHLFKPSTILSSSSSSSTSSSNYHLLHISALSVLLSQPKSSSPHSFVTKASTNDTHGRGVALNAELLTSLSAMKDDNEVLLALSDSPGLNAAGALTSSDCSSIIAAALDSNNPDLALSIFYAMRSSFDHGGIENGAAAGRLKWSRPDVNTYTLLIRGLAASLRVSDALKIISSVCRVAVSPGEEVPFGEIVKCPSCMIAVAVAQPQHGNQIVSCSKCRYKYELVSGDIVSIESEEISMDVPAWKRGLKFLGVMSQSIPAAVHSIVVESPSGAARTHRFATGTVDLPAQEGERVTVALAAPTDAYREFGPLKLSPKDPKFYSGEPLCLTNHKDGRESPLLRAPTKNGSASILNPSFLLPLIALLATGDAASGIIDPSLPQFISVAAVSSLALGSALNFLVVPQLSQLPQRMVDAIAIKQQLLSQYDTLQSRIKDLREAAVKEVWMLARMCQLENKIFAVGEPSYRTRKSKVKRVREGLENSLRGRIELIDNYARISSMIEIEIEMDTDVLVAEAANNAERIAEQIQQIMELENLEERWRIQAEANDEVERLLSSQPNLPEQETD